MCREGCVGGGCVGESVRGRCVEEDVGVVCYRCECGGGVQKCVLTVGFQIHRSS